MAPQVNFVVWPSLAHLARSARKAFALLPVFEVLQHQVPIRLEAGIRSLERTYSFYCLEYEWAMTMSSPDVSSRGCLLVSVACS